ncbi:MAG TPA: hypothetical protein DEV93_09595 [Chloroflexi bacterium]|nr:hypothetical protein [Chloroflexota bacterium]
MRRGVSDLRGSRLRVFAGPCERSPYSRRPHSARFLQALAALPRYQDRGLTIGSWLFRIARNAVTDYYRSSGRRTTVSWDSIAEGLYPLDPTSLEEDAARREQVVQILQLVHDLPREKQEVLALRFAAGLRVREIAEALDRSESAIKNELSRTLHLLKEHYDARH